MSRPAADDRRRQGQEAYLRGLPLRRSRFQAYSGNWDHEHCEFCFRKFLDAAYAPWMQQALIEEPAQHLASGFTNVRTDGVPAGRYWICSDCFEDFCPEFNWSVLDDDEPERWPYDTPEPNPRPTANDFDPSAAMSGP